MNKQLFHASSLLASLILLSGLLILLFLHKESWLGLESSSLMDYERYLSRRITLLNSMYKEDVCHDKKESFVKIKVGEEIYQYACQEKSIFLQPKPTKEKYIQVDNIKHYLDVDTYRSEIYFISHLSELPETTISTPKIVVAKNAIDEKLEKNFYGMIITDYYFDITGSKKIYGVLYSSFDNLREERNLTFSRAVVENIAARYAHWTRLSYSNHFSTYE